MHSELDSFHSPRLSNALLDVQLNFLGNWILSTCLFCSQSWEVTKCNVYKHDASSWRDVLTWEQICEKFHRLFSLLSGVWAARSGVFLGIFVFRPACERFTPRLSEKTYWTSFRTFGKFCISWTLLTVWRPTYFCKFVSYCPIRFGKVETGLDWPCFPLIASRSFFLYSVNISKSWTHIWVSKSI